MESYNAYPESATDRVEPVPLDSLPGTRCRRAIERLRSIRSHRHIAIDGVLGLRRGPEVDELALVDIHRSGLVLVNFTDAQSYILDLRGVR